MNPPSIRRSCYLLVEAAALLDLPRSTAFRLAAKGRFPVPVLRIGGLERSRWRVPARKLHEALGIPVDADPDEVLAARRRAS